jgi:hypothetical protein
MRDVSLLQWVSKEITVCCLHSFFSWEFGSVCNIPSWRARVGGMHIATHSFWQQDFVQQCGAEEGPHTHTQYISADALRSKKLCSYCPIASTVQHDLCAVVCMLFVSW